MNQGSWEEKNSGSLESEKEELDEFVEQGKLAEGSFLVKKKLLFDASTSVSSYIYRNLRFYALEVIHTPEGEDLICVGSNGHVFIFNMKGESLYIMKKGYLYYTLLGVPEHQVLIVVYDYMLYSIDLKDFSWQKIDEFHLGTLDTENKDLVKINKDTFAFVSATKIDISDGVIVYDYLERKMLMKLCNGLDIRVLHTSDEEDLLFVGGVDYGAVFDATDNFRMLKEWDGQLYRKEKERKEEGNDAKVYPSVMGYNSRNDVLVLGSLDRIWVVGGFRNSGENVDLLKTLPTWNLVPKNVGVQLSRCIPTEMILFKDYVCYIPWDSAGIQLHQQFDLVKAIQQKDESDREIVLGEDMGEDTNVGRIPVVTARKKRVFKINSIQWVNKKEKQNAIGLSYEGGVYLLQNVLYMKGEEMYLQDLADRIEFLSSKKVIRLENMKLEFPGFVLYL